jgi:catechol 2,3-dioxygenase-like lactoylglutathione lyase family enzyme
VVRDTASSIAFYAEDPTPTGSNPYPSYFGGRTPSELLAQFPWQHLQALRTDIRSQPR